MRDFVGIKKFKEIITLAVEHGYDSFAVWKLSGQFMGMNCFERENINRLEDVVAILDNKETEYVSIRPATKNFKTGYTERTMFITQKQDVYRITIWYKKGKPNHEARNRK